MTVFVSSFAFLGLGLPNGTAEWGIMLEEARVSDGYAFS